MGRRPEPLDARTTFRGYGQCFLGLQILIACSLVPSGELPMIQGKRMAWYGTGF